jgi:hypothetical protein
MRRILAKKTWLVAIAATAFMAVTVATAFAAPVLQPGVTSAPGMSGVCSDCHTYATPPVVTPPVVTPPVVTTPVATPPGVTPPVVTSPVVTASTAGEDHHEDGADEHVAKQAAHTKHHKARRHKKAHRHEHD